MPLPQDTERELLCKILYLLNGIKNIGNLLQGNGPPSAIPQDPTEPAYYTDLSNGDLWTWDATNQVWI